MAQKASRACFFIFNPTLEPETKRPSEEEVSDAKILYYSPSSAAVEEKRSQVGLLEGLIAFTGAFSGEKSPLRCIRTKQLAFSILEVEQNIWMVLAMKHPVLPPEGSQRGGSGEPQYDDESLGDETLMAVLRNCYGVFRLLHGEIQVFVKDKQMHKLFDLLEDFVPAFMETIDQSDMGIFHVIDGFHYGPVERNTCVSIHCFLGKLQEQFPGIRHCALLYNAHLIYSSFALGDMRVLYSYLVAFNGAVSNSKLNRAPYGRIPTAASQPGGGSSSFGRAFLLQEEDDFLFGMHRRPGSTSYFVPSVYLKEGGQGKLVVLTYHGIMLVLIFEESSSLDARSLEQVRDACSKGTGDGLSLKDLLPLITQQYAQVMEHEDEYRFIYYNQSNFALRLSNQPSSRSLLGSRSSGTGSLKIAERAALCPLHATLADPKFKCREVSWKSADRGWICAKRWREREFYLLLDGANVTLSKCQEECARFASIHFSNIFMM